jgi:hypothetical protein
MKTDQQTLFFSALFLIAIWLLFFRKTEKYCGGCGAAMIA